MKPDNESSRFKSDDNLIRTYPLRGYTRLPVKQSLRDADSKISDGKDTERVIREIREIREYREDGEDGEDGEDRENRRFRNKSEDSGISEKSKIT